MKLATTAIAVLSGLLITVPTAVRAQFTFTTNNGAITITGYTGTNPVVIIPDTTNGWPVVRIGSGAFASARTIKNLTVANSITNIGDNAFQNCTGLTNIVLGSGVTSFGWEPFYNCSALSAILVVTNNPIFSSFAGVLFNKSQSALVQCPPGFAGSYAVPGTVTYIGTNAFNSCLTLRGIMIPNSVTNIASQAFDLCGLTSVVIPNSVTILGPGAFFYCTSLTSATIGDSITNIQYAAFRFCSNLRTVIIGAGVTSITTFAFGDCPNLSSVYFKGNGPASLDYYAFSGVAITNVYCLPGSTGWDTWSATYPDLPVVLWNPAAQTGDGSFGTGPNGFGFNITGTTNIPILVEVITNLAIGGWTPLQTCTLTNGSIYFSDPAWSNFPNRFYRIRSP